MVSISYTSYSPVPPGASKHILYVRILFVDFSSAFNTIIPHKLVHKLNNLVLATTLCSWIMDFLTNRTQNVRIGNRTSTTIILNTDALQGCVLTMTVPPSTPPTAKFTDNTTVVGLVSNNEETHYRQAEWCSHNNLVLNTTKAPSKPRLAD
ncbi:hypothetical protein LDENG_00151450 [Lucifuga dentata]|nr:hypothetical protein LDENG_00151450 [Lucifuga dentata]